MKIQYFGHATVGLTSRGGTRVLCDPYEPGIFDGRFRYAPIPGVWDLVIVSHEHEDHNGVADSFGNPQVVRGPVQFAGMDIRIYMSRHGTNEGTMDLWTRVSRFVLDDMEIVHPGDIGPGASPDLIANLKGADILFMPVGGRFTMAPDEAAEFVSKVNPRLVIPIHYKTSAVDLPLRPVDEFLDLFQAVRTFPTGEVDLHAGQLPPRLQVWHLKPSAMP